MIRRAFIWLAKAVGVVLLAVFIVWFFPVMLPVWFRLLSDILSRPKKERLSKKFRSFYDLCEKEKKERFKRIEKKKKNFYK